MRRILIATAAALVLVSFAAPAQTPPKPAAGTAKSLGLVVFPAKNQTPDQQQKDDYDCYVWAKGQTNYDPAAPPPTPTAVAPEKQKGGAVKGAAKGAAGGAAVGAIAGDAGEGAAIGATAGAVRGRRQQKAADKQADEKAKSSQAAAAAGPKDQYKKAFQTCLQGKGYTVN
ncbi:MAG TPA: glycine zipper family protein [Thermoanaerobaculia bacterium]|nr:glycine zipper family protein [Thermoanaerobaculia bacterium]